MSETNNLSLSDEEIKLLPFLHLLNIEEEIKITQNDENEFTNLIESTMNKISTENNRRQGILQFRRYKRKIK